jgi:hypothetical protein
MLFVKTLSNILLVVLLLTLTGCIAKFDQHEYQQYIRLITLAEEKSCQPENIKELKRESIYLYQYAQHIPNNEHSSKATKAIYDTIIDLENNLAKGHTSDAYCSLKLEGISIMGQTFAEAIIKKRQ